MFRKYLLLISFIIQGLLCQAQSYLVVDNIQFTGQQWTKDYIIKKELNFSVGDTLLAATIQTVFHDNENRLYDTKLFNIVNITYTTLQHSKINVIVNLEKSWYIFPAPIFDVEAENMTTWWKEYNFDLKWVSYGARLDHVNLTGNQDKLKAVLQTGFTKKYELEYRRPYIFKSKFGAVFNAFYATNNYVGYKTEHNKVVYWDAKDTTVLKRYRLSASFSYRPNIHWDQKIDIQYHHNRIHERLAKELNSDYFLYGNTSMRFFMLQYHLSYDKRSFKLYPESGYTLFMSVKKEGLGVYKNINLFKAIVGYEQYFKTKKGLVLQFALEGKQEFTNGKVPYSNYDALGYGDRFLRGYELYILDGTSYILSRNSIRKLIYKSEYKLGKWMPLRPYRKIPIQFHFRFNVELGYVRDPYYKDTNLLNNQLLIGYGPALDIILFNNILLNVEYNFNRDGDNSLYLHSVITLRR